MIEIASTELMLVRLTLDIDGKNRGWWAWGIYYMLRDSGEFSRVELRRTRHGYHIVASGSGMSAYEIDTLRMSLGDDPLRVAIDMVKHPLQPRQVLWRVKRRSNDKYEVETLESCSC